MEDWIVSTAHEVLQGSRGYEPAAYVCARCGVRGGLNDLFGQARCTPHFESPLSGWEAES